MSHDFLLQPPSCWNYSRVPSHLTILGLKNRKYWVSVFRLPVLFHILSHIQGLMNYLYKQPQLVSQLDIASLAQHVSASSKAEGWDRIFSACFL